MYPIIVSNLVGGMRIVPTNPIAHITIAYHQCSALKRQMASRTKLAIVHSVLLSAINGTIAGVRGLIFLDVLLRVNAKILDKK